MSTDSIVYRQACRFCGSRDVRRFLHFENIPFFDEVIPEERLGKEFLAPMDVYWCGECHCVQSQHDVNVSAYYTDYQYVASDSPFIRAFMDTLAGEVFSRFALQPGDHVIEVGSADGYQLAGFQARGATVLGFEPAENLCELSRKRGVEVVADLFTADSWTQIPDRFKPVQAFVLLHTFDHLLDPVPFLELVSRVLDPERGVLILEVHDLREIMDRRETSLLGHEHATFLHLGSMSRVLDRCGLVLLDANFVPENMRRGNSMLIAAGVKGGRHLPSIRLAEEDFARFDQWPTYEDFARTVDESFARVRDHVRAQVAAGRRLAGYGAWGRGVTTLAMAGLTACDFVFVCDRNPFLHGKFTPGSQVPIAPPERLLEEEIDEVIVFNYGYLEEIRHQLAAYTERGGRLTSVLDLLGGRQPA